VDLPMKGTMIRDNGISYPVTDESYRTYYVDESCSIKLRNKHKRHSKSVNCD
jgi:hypothetical protein